MRYTASEKLEIIQLVEQSNLPVRRTLVQLGIPKSTFYDWYRRYVEGGLDALQDQPPQPTRVWNKVPEETGTAIIELALTEPALSPRELAVKYTDTAQYYVSESTVYRLLKARDLITSPAFIVMQAADQFSHPTTRVNQLWQTDFTYLKVVGWGWYYLSTVLDDYSRFILTWRLCTGMAASDVSATLEDALAFAELEQVKVVHRPRLLSDNGPSYVSSELAAWLEGKNMTHTRGRTAVSSNDPGQDRTLASLDEERGAAGELLSTGAIGIGGCPLRGLLQPRAVSREPQQSDAGRRVLRSRCEDPRHAPENQTANTL